MTPERLEYLGVLNPTRYGERLDALQAGDDRAERDVWRGFVYTLWCDRFDVRPVAEPAPTRHAAPSVAVALEV
jgi:hypothetical protein